MFHVPSHNPRCATPVSTLQRTRKSGGAGNDRERLWCMDIEQLDLPVVIVVRLGWTVAAAMWSGWRIKHQRGAAAAGASSPSWRTGLLVGWAGTRGIVTIATALALPQNFPEREMLLFA